MSKKSKSRFSVWPGFKIPKNQRDMVESTPCKDENDTTVSCNLSVLPTGTMNAPRSRHASVPRASTPTNDEATLSFDVSAIKARSVNTNTLRTKHQKLTQPKKGTLFNNAYESSAQAIANKVAKQAELDTAYDTYVLSLMTISQEKQHSDTNDEIEAALGSLSKRLAVNQLNLENTRQRVNMITFNSKQERLLEARTNMAAETLAHVEGETTQAVSAIASAVGDKIDNLELHNVVTGTAELKKIISDCKSVLNKLKATNKWGDSKVSEAEGCLNTMGDEWDEVETRSARVAKSMPRFQGVGISMSMMQTYKEATEKEEHSETCTLEDAEESSVFN